MTPHFSTLVLALQIVETLEAAKGGGQALVWVVVILLAVAISVRIVGPKPVEAFGRGVGGVIAERVLKQLREKRR